MRNLMALLLCVLFCGASASASTEKIIWNFSGTNGDGSNPWSNYFVTDGKGNLYATTGGGGTNSTGMVFMLSPKSGGGYRETILYDFGAQGSGDGANPYGTLAFDGDGGIYGTTDGGGANGSGSIYKLTPKRGGGWTEEVLYSFSASGLDGAAPAAGVTIGPDGSLYGTTSGGGANGVGAVYKLANTKSGWKEKVIHSFVFGSTDGSFPYEGVMMDSAGNLYGTAPSGGSAGYGVVYKLAPTSKGWKETLLHSFTDQNGDGSGMYYINLISDAAGNIYGATSFGGTNGTGTVWKLVYSKTKKTYTEKILYIFGAEGSGDGNYPYGGLAMDAKGNLYGTTENGGSASYGTVYKLSHSGSKWKETILHSFTGGTDGEDPSGNPLLDSSGNIFGLAQFGGKYNLGIAYRIAP